MKSIPLLLLIVATFSIQSNLTQYNDAPINISVGLDIIHVRPNNDKIYGIAANASHFQIFTCSWPYEFIVIDESPFFMALIDLTAQHSKNPRIYFMDSLLKVRYYESTIGTAKIVQASLSDLTSYTIATRGEVFLGEPVSSIDSFYYKN